MTTKIPPPPDAAPPPADPTDDALRRARLMERRKELGLQGRMTTFLTGAQGDTAPAQIGTKTLLGG
jgi:hypothetical protein